MNAQTIPSITVADLQADAALQDRVVEVHLRGSAEMRAKSGLDGFLDNVFSASSGCREVVVDLRELEFMNSSCFKSLLTWIVRIDALPPSARYKVRFISNPSLHWQKRSLHSLASMGQGIVEVEEPSETA